MATHYSTLAQKTPWTEEPGAGSSVHGVTKSQTRLSNFTFTFHFLPLIPDFVYLFFLSLLFVIVSKCLPILLIIYVNQLLVFTDFLYCFPDFYFTYFFSGHYCFFPFIQLRSEMLLFIQLLEVGAQIVDLRSLSCLI